MRYLFNRILIRCLIILPINIHSSFIGLRTYFSFRIINLFSPIIIFDLHLMSYYKLVHSYITKVTWFYTVRCQTKVLNCKCSYLCCYFFLLCSEILLLIEFCFIASLILLISSPCPKYTSLGVRLSNDSRPLQNSSYNLPFSNIFRTFIVWNRSYPLQVLLTYSLGKERSSRHSFHK